MKATLISKENNEAKFTIEITAEEFENAIIDVYKSQKDKFVIDGFRKGKAPRSIIEKKYGESIFFEDAINKLFSLHVSCECSLLHVVHAVTPTACSNVLKA